MCGKKLPQNSSQYSQKSILLPDLYLQDTVQKGELGELQHVGRELTWTCDRYMLGNDRWSQAAMMSWFAGDELDECPSDVYVNDCDGDYTDEATGVTLLRDDVAKARAEEMDWYEKFNAYEEVTDETCVSRTGRKPISCRWRDINKGDNERAEAPGSHVKSNRRGQTATSQEQHR